MLYTENDVSRLARILNNGRATKLSLMVSHSLLNHFKYFKTVCHLPPNELEIFPHLNKTYFQNFIIWRATRIHKMREKLKQEPLILKSRALREYCEFIFKGSSYHGLRIFVLNHYYYYQDDGWIAFSKNYTKPEMWYRDVVKYALDHNAYAVIIAFNKLGIIEDHERFILEEFQDYIFKLPVIDLNLLGIIQYDGSKLRILH